jgi:thymidylate synthase ThyX
VPEPQASAAADAADIEQAARAAIAAHVTDVAAPVYGIVDLPEEVVAVVLAYVSRSPKSFRDNLGELVAQGFAATGGDGGPSRAFAYASDKARAFHERWVVNYGHASVAEHATVHLGVEGVSRLASAALETANPFLSFTEFSQRYQRPVRGGYVTPPEVARLAPNLARAYGDLQEELFDAYEAILDGVADHVVARGTIAARAGEAAEAVRRRARRRAFEDARYALSLAVRTSLGLTANARALRDAIALLGESPWGEVRDLAASLREQAGRMLPTLLRHAEPAVEAPARAPVAPAGPDADRLAALFGDGGEAEAPAEGDVRLIAPTGDNAAPERARAALAAALALAGDGAAAADPVAHLAARRRASGPYAPAHGALRAVRYRFALRVSEANWHQLLRHTRGMVLFAAPPGCGDDITVPPLVAEAGLDGRLRAAAAAAAARYARLVDAGAPNVAAYGVTNAHRRLVVADLDLWELDHLVRLRLKDNAQWDIRRTVRAMARAAIARHPFLRDLWGPEVEMALPDEAP